MSKPRLVLVVAVADNASLARDGKLPWKIPGDLKHFKELTMGKPVDDGPPHLRSRWAGRCKAA